MATKVEESQFEVEAQLLILGPRLQGLRNLAELSVSANPDDVSPRAHQDILDSGANYDRRIKLMNAQRDADLALLADGYPDMPFAKIEPAALENIRHNAASVVLAAETFVSNVPPAANLNLTAGAVEPKG